jgi:catechol 2,3-dioxygenase-like lactoylglutathione lyase family enzyme
MYERRHRQTGARWIGVAALLLQLTQPLGAGQGAPTAPPPGPRAIGASFLHLNVASLDRALGFYRDVLGLEVVTPPGEPRAGTNLVSEPGARLRTVVLKAPRGSFRLELVEWSGTPLKPQQARIQDPGAIMMAFRTSTLDVQLAAARRLGLTVLTANGEPLVGGGRSGQTRAVMLRDADGFVVELLQPLGDPAPGAISEVQVFLTVADLAQTVAFYNSAFGFDMAAPGPPQPASDRIRTLFGEPALRSIRSARGTFPGSDVTFEFQEFGAPDRKPVRHRVQDPGGPILPVTVQDLPGVVERVRAGGGIVGTGETSEAMARDARAVWVRDPNGLLLQLALPRPRS